MTMTCPDPGRLRAWLDARAADVSEATAEDGAGNGPIDLTDHLAGCADCQATCEALQQDAVVVGRALASLASPPPSAFETEQALARLHQRLGRQDASGLDTPDLAAPSFLAPECLTVLTPHAPPPAGTVAETLDVPAARTNGRLAPSPAPAPTTAPAAPGRRSMTMTLVYARWRIALGGLAAALVLTFLLGTPEGRVATAAFLAQFRSQRLTIVTFDPNQMRQTGLFRLEHLGTVTNPRPPQPTQLPSVDEAARRAGFPVLQPDPATLPPNASKTPTVRFSPATETRLTFDKQKVRQYFDSIGRKDAALPDNLNGATLVVSLPPVVILEYGAADGKPAVMVGQAREVQVGVEGNASLEEVRSFLLTAAPEDVARQLRSIQDWRSTLPIPVPVDKISWQPATVGTQPGFPGYPGYLLNDNTGLGSAVIFQRDGRIMGAAGPMRATDLVNLAGSMK